MIIDLSNLFSQCFRALEVVFERIYSDSGNCEWVPLSDVTIDWFVDSNSEAPDSKPNALRYLRYIFYYPL